jgi:hypothetical protein
MPHSYRASKASVLLFSCILCNNLGFASDYYVSWQGGNDGNNGLSTSSPWKSIARVNHAALRPGDRVLLHAGETWQEELRPEHSGMPDLPIIFTTYGIGLRAILEGQSPEAGRSIRVSKILTHGTNIHDVAIDNNGQSYIVYDRLELRNVLEGLRVYSWSGAVRGITLQNCWIQTNAAKPRRDASAGVYANVKTGSITDLRILGNHLTPYSRGLNHWGIYFAGGVQHFWIEENELGPAGEDGITIWHSAYGEISHNRGGGNGENTIDVKDSHDINIRDNNADLDREYNIVVHSVDAPNSTYNILVQRNRCSRGGQGGELSAGIALLFVQKSGIEDNLIDFAFGSGILIKDSGRNPQNWASHNRLTGNGVGQQLPAIVLQGTSMAQLEDNQIVPKQGSVK